MFRFTAVSQLTVVASTRIIAHRPTSLLSNDAGRRERFSLPFQKSGGVSEFRHQTNESLQDAPIQPTCLPYRRH